MSAIPMDSWGSDPAGCLRLAIAFLVLAGGCVAIGCIGALVLWLRWRVAHRGHQTSAMPEMTEKHTDLEQ